jgi:hypothetical protein
MKKGENMNKILRASLFLALSIALVLSSSEVIITTTVKAQDAGILNINGAVSNPVSLTIADLQAMPKTEISAPLYCNGILISDGAWDGVTVVSLLQKAGADPYATDIMFIGSDGYTKNIAMGAAVSYSFIVAYELNGQPIPEGLRLILPGYNGAFWVAWIANIKVTSSTTYDIAAPYDGILLPAPTAALTEESPVTPTTEPTQPPAPTAPPAAVTTPPTPTLPTEQPTVTATPTPATAAQPTSTSNAMVPQIATPEPSVTQTHKNQPTTAPTTPAVEDQYIQPVESSGIGTSLSLIYAVAGIVIVISVVAGLLVLQKRHVFVKKQA